MPFVVCVRTLDGVLKRVGRPIGRVLSEVSLRGRSFVSPAIAIGAVGMSLPWARYPKLMTDSKLRELERRWKETQSVEDEAAYLLERVRVGDLEREKLELAAYCGREGALAALGWESDPTLNRIETWIRGLEERASERTLLKAALDCVRLILPNLQKLVADPKMIEDAVHAAADHLASPCPSSSIRAGDTLTCLNDSELDQSDDRVLSTGVLAVQNLALAASVFDPDLDQPSLSVLWTMIDVARTISEIERLGGVGKVEATSRALRQVQLAVGRVLVPVVFT